LARQQAHAEVAEVAQPGLTRNAFSAGRDERHDHVIADGQVLDALAYLGDDAGALVTAQHGIARDGEVAGLQM
jgi:hypothetical protein